MPTSSEAKFTVVECEGCDWQPLHTGLALAYVFTWVRWIRCRQEVLSPSEMGRTGMLPMALAASQTVVHWVGLGAEMAELDEFWYRPHGTAAAALYFGPTAEAAPQAVASKNCSGIFGNLWIHLVEPNMAFSNYVPANHLFIGFTGAVQMATRSTTANASLPLAVPTQGMQDPGGMSAVQMNGFLYGGSAVVLRPHARTTLSELSQFMVVAAGADRTLSPTDWSNLGPNGSDAGDGSIVLFGNAVPGEAFGIRLNGQWYKVNLTGLLSSW